MKNYTLLLVFLLEAVFLFATNPIDEAYKQDYLAKYSTLAQSEMRRVGIPASIKLAQGILESSWGRSELTQNSNNHFGLKCKTDDGFDCYFKEDDDYVEGKLVKSPFRKYQSAEASYMDHSNYLYNNPRYDLCFAQGMDYRAWAHALKSCGYATAKDYAEKIIATIERYNLQRYDVLVSPIHQPVATLTTKPVPQVMHIVSALSTEYRYIYRIVDFEMTGQMQELPLEQPLVTETPQNVPVAEELAPVITEIIDVPAPVQPIEGPKEEKIYEPVAPPRNSRSMARKLNRHWDLPATF